MQHEVVIAMILLAAAAILLFAVVIICDSNRLVRREYTVASSKISRNCRIVLLTDLHNKSFGKENNRLLKEIEKINPDMIVVAGDMLTANEKRTKIDVPLALFERLTQKYPVYYANGNHEYRMKVYTEGYGDLYLTYTHRLKEFGVHLLENERVCIPSVNIEICGLEIEKYYYKRIYHREMSADYINSCIGKSKTDCFELLIAHNPDYFKEYAAWGADLTVSGHVHGGVMRLPVLGGVISPMMHFFPKYDGGLFQEYGSRMILGRGLGMHTVPVRIFNPGEVVVMNLKHG